MKNVKFWEYILKEENHCCTLWEGNSGGTYYWGGGVTLGRVALGGNTGEE